MLWAILNHHLSELIVHVFPYASRCFFFNRVCPYQDLRLHWASSGERLHDAFGLEAHNRLSQAWGGTHHKHRSMALFFLRTSSPVTSSLQRRSDPIFAIVDVFVKVATNSPPKSQAHCRSMKSARLASKSSSVSSFWAESSISISPMPIRTTQGLQSQSQVEEPYPCLFFNTQEGLRTNLCP
jgi:hypothetical protein